MRRIIFAIGVLLAAAGTARAQMPSPTVEQGGAKPAEAAPPEGAGPSTTAGGSGVGDGAAGADSVVPGSYHLDDLDRAGEVSSQIAG